MNLNEFFFFKVFECLKDSNNKINSNHREDKCYFFHVSITHENGIKKIIEKDRRREPVSFSDFFENIYKILKEEENSFFSMDKIFEFKKDKNKNYSLNYYIDCLSFEPYNEYIYYDTDYCRNETEFFYHINRYKTNICNYYKILGRCKKTFCYRKHINSSNKDNINIINETNKINDNINEGIIKFKNEINNWLERKEIKFKEIINLYNYIFSFENKYLSDLQINEKKRFFLPFQKLLNDKINNINNTNYNQRNINNFNIIPNINENDNRIIHDITKQLNSNNNLSKIYKNYDLFESLKISTNVCFISNSSSIKLSEIVRYVYAMLNSSNGVIIYGGNEKYKTIKGISLKRKEREDFKKWFNTEFFKILLQYEDYIKFKFYDLTNNNNDECILIIHVKQVKHYKLLTSFSSQKCYIINQNIFKNKKGEKNVIINDNDIIELNTKEYIELLRKKLLFHYSKKYGVKINTL